MHISFRGPQGNYSLRLDDVAYCPDLLTNLVSFRLLRKQGIWWDTQADPTILRRADNTILAELQELHGQWVIEHNSERQEEHTAAFSVYKTNSSTKRAVQKANAATWHKQMGHPGPKALEHLVQQSKGVKIMGLTTVQCDACGRAKSRRQVRRTPREFLEQLPGERIMVDFHDYEEDSFNKEKSQMLITDKFSGFTWDFYFTGNRTASAIIKHFSAFVNFLKVQFNLTVKVIESDNEIFSVKPEVKRWCTNKGIAIEPSAPDTQAQNGGAKRSCERLDL